MKVMKMPFMFTQHVEELIEVDKIEADCLGIKTDCTIKRTRNKIPSTFEGYWGPLIRAVTSLDGEEEILPTNPRQYVRKSSSPSFKYNKNKYYWFLNGYLYFPDLEWDGIKIDAAFEFKSECGELNVCDYPHKEQVYLPKYIVSTIQAQVLQDLGLPLQIQKNPEEDKNKAI
jgi:hypothetical protein